MTGQVEDHNIDAFGSDVSGQRGEISRMQPCVGDKHHRLLARDGRTMDLDMHASTPGVELAMFHVQRGDIRSVQRDSLRCRT